MRPFSRSSADRERSGHSSGLSFSGLRWSLDEVRSAFSRSKSNGKKKRAKNLSDGERKKRRDDRLKARKEKKSKREKERRNQVNGLIDTLGEKVGVDQNDRKGNRLTVLSAAVTKLKDQKGIERGLDDDFDDDYDDYDSEDSMTRKL